MDGAVAAEDGEEEVGEEVGGEEGLGDRVGGGLGRDARCGVRWGWRGSPVLLCGCRRWSGAGCPWGRVWGVLARLEAGGRPPAAGVRAGPPPGVRGGAVPPGAREAVPPGRRASRRAGGRVAGRCCARVMTLFMGVPVFVGPVIPGSNFVVGDLVRGRRGQRQGGGPSGARALGMFTYPGGLRAVEPVGAGVQPGEFRAGGGRVRRPGPGLERGPPHVSWRASGALRPSEPTTKAASHACLRAPDPSRPRRGAQDG